MMDESVGHETVGAHSDEEVDHEEDVECEIELLSCILGPGYTGLHSVTTSGQVSGLSL